MIKRFLVVYCLLLISCNKEFIEYKPSINYDNNYITDDTILVENNIAKFHITLIPNDNTHSTIKYLNIQRLRDGDIIEDIYYLRPPESSDTLYYKITYNDVSDDVFYLKAEDYNGYVVKLKLYSKEI